MKFVECWGDDVPEGKVTSFPMAVKRKDDETVVFSWIIWPSRNVRDEAMKKVMASPEFRAQIEKVGARPVGNSPAEFSAQIRREIARMKRLVTERQIKLDE